MSNGERISVANIGDFGNAATPMADMTNKYMPVILRISRSPVVAAWIVILPVSITKKPVMRNQNAVRRISGVWN